MDTRPSGTGVRLLWWWQLWYWHSGIEGQIAWLPGCQAQALQSGQVRSRLEGLSRVKCYRAALPWEVWHQNFDISLVLVHINIAVHYITSKGHHHWTRVEKAISSSCQSIFKEGALLKVTCNQIRCHKSLWSSGPWGQVGTARAVRCRLGNRSWGCTARHSNWGAHTL